MRELDVEAHGEPATLFRAAVRRLHDTGTTAGDDGPPTLCEAARDVPCLFVGRLSLAHACGAEDRDRRTVDLVDRFESHAKFLRDALDVILDLSGGLVRREDALIFHLKAVRDVCRVHAEDERRGEGEVHEPHDQAQVRRDTVVLLHLRMAA